MSKETNIHAGHRASMRRKYLTLGATAFLPHELLEILLYYVVPVCDTNPTAHRLLDRFGSLSAVFAAKDEELLSVRGVGERSVRLFRLVHALGLRIRSLSGERAALSGDALSLEELVLSLSSGDKADLTRLILLDGAGRLLAAERIAEGEASTLRLEPRLLVQPALRHRAVTAVLCSYPRSHALRPGAYDYEATAALRDALSLVGVRLAEHFIVSGGYAARLSRQLPGCLESEPDVTAVFSADSCFTAEDARLLSALLGYGGCEMKGEALTELLLSFGGTYRLATSSPFELIRRGIPERAALLISLALELYIRSTLTESGQNARLDSADRLGRHLVHHYLGATGERVLLLLLDSGDRLIRTELLSEGVVDGAPIELRRAAELALLHEAVSAVLAHNHPGGSLIPSPEDIETTALLSDALASVDVPLIEHFVIAGEQYLPIRLWSSALPTLRPLDFYGAELIARTASLGL